MTCCPDATTDPTKRAAVCLACSLNCHESHELIELYTKRNFRCDCGNPKFNSKCQFTPDKTDVNEDNKYNQNFSGQYCVCSRPYPDPDATEDDDMIQCIVCEDWFHTQHLEATVPPNNQYSEMICKSCMDDNLFLHDYSCYAIGASEFGLVDIMSNGDGDESLCNGDSKNKDNQNTSVSEETPTESSLTNKDDDNSKEENINNTNGTEASDVKEHTEMDTEQKENETKTDDGLNGSSLTKDVSEPNQIDKTDTKPDDANISSATDANGTNDTDNNKQQNVDELTNSNKRKLSTDECDLENTAKKPNIEEKPCKKPRGGKVFFKGATFWSSNFRQQLCTCNKCVDMYKDLSVLFLTDPDDTVTAYEALGKEKIEGKTTSQYERGLQALSSLDRVQQINALTEYNKMRDKLLDFLKSFKDRKEIVKEEDIKAFFADMKPRREPDGVYFCR